MEGFDLRLRELLADRLERGDLHKILFALSLPDLGGRLGDQQICHVMELDRKHDSQHHKHHV